MKCEERLKEIIQILHKEGAKTTTELAAFFSVSRESICSTVREAIREDKMYYRRNETGNTYLVLIPDNCKAELYKRISVADWIAEQERLKKERG